ncbi:hypothetical protein MLD38_010902 [Melastoma candidum]|uniref:Uncharacterized protein n=1 Tax=Melastoma candidum TaxID=119954 RepID=A0ACB9R1C3_9MYRT|nr:hypothetical protein MLD38_010902 [Melastoma candidum]
MARAIMTWSVTGNTQFLSDAPVSRSGESQVLSGSRFLGFSSELTGRRGFGGFALKVGRFVALASVATAEKPSKLPEIVLQPIRETSCTVKLPGSKSLSNRVLLLAALSEVG